MLHRPAALLQTYEALRLGKPLITVLVALNARFDPETQRDELRTAAASLESEIYKFRTRTCEYGRLSAMGVSSGGAARARRARPPLAADEARASRLGGTPQA